MIKRPVLTTILALALLLAIVGVCAVPWRGLTAWERWREMRSGRIFTRAQTREKILALTFDDGPDPRYTPHVLEALKRHHVHATFFICGTMAARNPDLVRQIVAAGERVGLHTDT